MSLTGHSLLEALNRGNQQFVERLEEEDRSGGAPGGLLEKLGRLGETPKQAPQAAVLGCSDARVPVLDVFQRRPGEVFEVRLAGNVPSAECLGSLEYAVENLPSVGGIVVLGHSGCGAVTAAVDAFLAQKSADEDSASPVLSLVKHILPAVEAAAAALKSRGDQGGADAAARRQLIDAAVFVNAAAGAYTIHEFVGRLGRTVPVWYAVYDLASWRVVHVAANKLGGGLRPGLGAAPSVPEEVDAVAAAAAREV